MELEDDDTTLSMVGRKIVKLTYRFMDANGKVQEFSPSLINDDQVKSTIDNNKRKVGETVATLGSILVGSLNHSQILAFVSGWYNRKFFESLEALYGEGEISIEEEALTRDKLKTIVSKGMRNQAKKMIAQAKEVEEGGLIDQGFDDLDEEDVD